jgi:polyferredoxin
LQNALSASKTRTPAYIFGTLILFGLLLGRTICGFLCPIGLGQDLLYKIKTPKLKKSRVTRVLSYFKYVVLIALVVIVPLAFTVPGFCEYICPAGTFEGGLGLLTNPNNEGLLANLGPLFSWKFTLLVLIIVASVFIFRVFCRFLCPLGAIYGFFSKIALLGVKLDKEKCTDCDFA